MKFLADKIMVLLGHINTVDCTGLSVALPRKPLATLPGWFIGLGNWKPMSSSLPQSTTGNCGSEQKVGEEGEEAGKEEKSTDTRC